MPIIDIELVTSAADGGPPQREQLQVLADKLGHLFNSEPANTWVKLRTVDVAQYAENRTDMETSAKPVFVNVLRAQLPDANRIRAEMVVVAEIVARTLKRPRENVHVLYAPDARGRIGFGGQLVE